MRHKSWSSRPGDLTIRGPLQMALLGQRPAKGLSRRQAQRPRLEGRRYLPRRRVLTLHKKFCVFTIFIVVDLGSTCDICLGSAADPHRSAPQSPCWIARSVPRGGLSCLRQPPLLQFARTKILAGERIVGDGP
jgi:hypothetical protein